MGTSDHRRHIFDQLNTVYQEKVTITNDKLNELKQLIENIEKQSAIARNNLDVVEATEQNVLSDINALMATARAETAASVAEKRRQLKQRIELPANRKALVEQLEERIKSLSQCNFIKQHNDLNGACDKLRELFRDHATDVIDHCDIGCELIPAAKMTTIEIKDFCTIEKLVTVNVDDSIGESWKLCITKGDELAMEISPIANDLLLSASRQFKMITEIHNGDISKSIRKRFVFQRRTAKFALTNVGHLTSGGYLSGGSLVLLVAIEPINILEACAHYKEKVELLKTSVDFFRDSSDNYKNSLKMSEDTCENAKKDLIRVNDLLKLSEESGKRANSELSNIKNTLKQTKENYEKLKSELNQQKNQRAGLFYVDFSAIPKKEQYTRYLSPIWRDSSGSQWQLDVQMDAQGHHKEFISVFINPVPTKTTKNVLLPRSFFIELIHSNNAKSVRRTMDYVFEAEGSGVGWHEFIKRSKILNDTGFQHNGKVLFRYEVCPLVCA